MSLNHPQKTESELISKRVENSKKEIEKLKAEYEKLVQQGLANSKSSTISDISPSAVCVESGEQKLANERLTSATCPFKEDVKKVKSRISSTESSVKKCSRSPTKVADDNIICSSKYKKSYDVEEARKFIQKQKEKRLEEIRMKLKESVNTIEERKRKLKELNEKSLKIITKNRERSLSKSKQTPCATDITLHPHPSTDINKCSKVTDQKRASRGRITVRSRHLEPPQLTHCVDENNLREKAATILQSHFRGYKQRKIYKQMCNNKKEQEIILSNTLSNEKDIVTKQIKSKSDFPDWLQATQSYPYNFISAVKQKLNIAINTPTKMSDVAIQNTIQSPHSCSKQLKEKIKQSINKIPSESNPTPTLNLEETIEWNLSQNLNSNYLRNKLVRSISRSERNSSSKSNTNLNSNNIKKNTCRRSNKVDSVKLIEKNIHTAHEHTPMSKKDSEFNLDLKAVELLKLKTRNADKSGSDTSKNIPELSTENSLNSKHIISITKDYSSSFESQHNDKSSKDNSVISNGVLKSIYSQDSSSKEANSSVGGSRNSNTSIESYKTYSKKSIIQPLNQVSNKNKQEDIFKKPQGVAKKSKKFECDVSISKNSNKENSNPIISVKTVPDFTSDSENDYKLEIDTERLKHLKLTRRKEHHDGFDNTIEVTGDFGSRKRTHSIELSNDIFDIPLVENSKITSNNNSIKYTVSQVSNKNLESIKSSKSANSDLSANKTEAQFNSNRSISKDIINDQIAKSQISNHSNSENSLRRQSIIISSNQSKFSSDYSKHSREGRDTLESESVQEDLVSFRNYIRDFKKNRHHPEKKDVGEANSSAKDNVSSFKTMKSSISDSGSDKSKKSVRSEDTTIDEKLSSEVIEAVPLVAPIVSLQSNYDSDNNDVKDKHVRKVTLKVGEKEFNTVGTSNQIHVKFEAELHLLNDFNESLRQFMAVEKSLLDLQNKNNIQHETMNTQTSLFAKSTTIPNVSSSSETSTRSSNIPTVASLNYSRGSDFHLNKSSLTLNSIEDSFVNNSALGNEELDFSDIDESKTNNSRNKNIELSQVVNKDNTVYIGLSLGMFEQLIKDEDTRIENLKTILKIREKALLDRTKGELAWLEIQKKHLLETGKLHEASLVKKKQRGILIKLQHEKHEMQKLKQMQKAASKERKTILKEKRNMIKTQLSMNSTITKIKRTSKERKASGPVKVYNYHRETVKSETSISKRSSITEEVIYETRSESIMSKIGEGTEIGNISSGGIEQKNILENTCTEIAKRSLIIREAALQKRRKAAEELLQWHQKLLEEERKITKLEMAASNIINQVPIITIENSSSTDGYKFLGSQLNVLWENMTGRADKKFKDNENYNLSQTALERFCKDAKNFSNKKSTSEQSHIQEKTFQHNNNLLVIDKSNLELEKGIKQSESTLDEIMQNISNITDEISELYKLSSAKTDQISDELQSAMPMDMSIIASISEKEIIKSHKKVPESSIESVSIKTAQSDRIVNSDNNHNSVKELSNENSENSMSFNSKILHSGQLETPHIAPTSINLSNELESASILNLANTRSEISEINGSLLSECGNTNEVNLSLKQYSSVSSIESLNKISETSIQKEIGKGEPLTQSIQEINDITQAIQNIKKSQNYDETIESIKGSSQEDTESLKNEIAENNSCNRIDVKQRLANAEPSIEQSLISVISEQKNSAIHNETLSNSSISDLEQSSIKEIIINSDNANIYHDNQENFEKSDVAKLSDSDKFKYKESLNANNEIAFENNSDNKKITPSSKSSKEEIESLSIDCKSDNNISSEISDGMKTLARNEIECEMKESLENNNENSQNASVKQSFIVFKTHNIVQTDNEGKAKITDELEDYDVDDYSASLKITYKDKEEEIEKLLTLENKEEAIISEQSDIEENIVTSCKQNAEEKLVLLETNNLNSEQNIPSNSNSKEVSLEIEDFIKSENNANTESDITDLNSEFHQIEKSESNAILNPTYTCNINKSNDITGLNEQFDFELQMLKSNQRDDVFNLSTSNEESKLNTSKSESKDIILLEDNDDSSLLKIQNQISNVEIISPDENKSSLSLEKSELSGIKSTESNQIMNIGSIEEKVFELEVQFKANNQACYGSELNELSSTESGNISKLLSADILETIEDKSTSSIVSEMSEQMSSNDELNIPVIEVMIEEKKQKLKNTDLKEDEDTENSRTSISDSPKLQVNVKQRVSEILADANINVGIGNKSPRLQDLYVTTYDVITPEGSPELGSPVENKTLLSTDIYGNEAEELLRKQLAIEQEIKQLEQQQLPYLYMREIPNKPPPPYTPPVQSIPVMPPTVLPMTIEQIFTITPDISKILFDAYKHNTLSLASLPDDRIFDNVDKECVEFVFDLCKEIASEHYNQFEEVSTVSWMKCNNRRLGFKKKLKQSEFKKFLDSQLKQTFGFEKVELKESMIIKWSRKKRDHVDELLVFESQAEEAEWTNYDQDELIVKNDVTQDIMHILLKETAEVFEKIVKKKIIRNVC